VTDESAVNTMPTRATVAPMAGSLGVRIEGVDVAADAGAQLVAVLRTILDEHLVIHLPAQDDLDPAALRAFADLWGEVTRDVNVPSLPGHPGVLEVGAPNPHAERWHHDVPYVDRPPAVTMHVARAVPASGGDTLWVDQYDAFERLSPGLRETLDGLFAVQEITFAAGNGDARFARESSVHPLVLTHDRTRRRALFVDAHATTRLDGWDAAESAALLQFLVAEAGRSGRTCRHRWAVGDLVIWDNRATLHRSLADVPPGAERVLHRVTIAGEIPR
jgi:taurine dioxygenase